MKLLNRLSARLYRLLATAIFFTSYLGGFSITYAGAIGELNASISSDKIEDETVVNAPGDERHLRITAATGWNFELSEFDTLSGGVNFRADRGIGNSNDVIGYGFGIFGSWHRGPFSIRADYILLAELKSDNGFVETSFRDGQGYALQARWLFGSEKNGIGPMLGFEQMKYPKSRVGTLPETSASRTTTAILLGITSQFYF